MQYRYLSIFAIAFIAASCTKELATPSEPVLEEDTHYVEYPSAVEGELVVKVSEELASQLELAVATKATAVQALSSAVVESLGVKSMTRSFPYAGDFEERTRREGLHLWYNVVFDSGTSNTRAAASLLDIEGITYVEDRRKPYVQCGEVVPCSSALSASRGDDGAVFNDPLLPSQWNYTNRATVEGFVEGMDINVEPLWRSGVAGNSAIIVGVVDGGADLSHPDLKDNIYVNEAELNGEPGVDDDKNGKVDDIHGYNFVSDSNEILPHDHGTHVSGTVAAVNNNGIGVAGVAGGDGTPGSGVKLLLCQIFEHKASGEDAIGDGATAIKYSADAGAIISQNSWGYPTADISQLDRDAIDYFVKYAGVDKYGNQKGPMKGGIVVFAAGNENVVYANPGQHESAVCVTAIAPDGQRAPYSNYGDWADIAAPGGEKVRWLDYIGGVLSTIPMNKYQDETTGVYVNYGSLTGTSMACPHVSGAIALYLSKQYELGLTDGLTPDVVIERLLNTTRSLVDFEPVYYPQMGRGLIDVSRFVGIESAVEPSVVEDLAVEEVRYTSVDLKWSAPANAKGYTIYCSEEPLDDIGDAVREIDVNKMPDADGVVSYTVINLMPSTEYHFAIRSWDYDDKFSTLSAPISVTTEDNRAPLFYVGDEQVPSYSLSLSPVETPKMVFNIVDPDGDKVVYSYEAGSQAESAIYNESSQILTLFVNGSKASTGDYVAKFSVKDIYGAATTFEVSYTIRENQAPVVLSEIADIALSSAGESRSVELAEYFKDSDSQAPLTFVAESSNSSIATCSIDESSLVVTSRGYGVSTITVTATDKLGASVASSFIVRCGSDSSYSIVLYPNPVSTTLSIKSEALSLERLTIYNANGVAVLTTDDLSERRVDVSSLRRGVYSVDVVVAGRSNVLNITKL